MLINSATTVTTASIPPQPKHLLAMAGIWLQRRRTRRDLADLDERLLRDIGLSPSDAIAESAMPFWRPFVWFQGK
jgi:uncharacterized protein YjiS (DUF1127 family)